MNLLIGFILGQFWVTVIVVPIITWLIRRTQTIELSGYRYSSAEIERWRRSVATHELANRMREIPDDPEH